MHFEFLTVQLRERSTGI